MKVLRARRSYGVCVRVVLQRLRFHARVGLVEMARTRSLITLSFALTLSLSLSLLNYSSDVFVANHMITDR